MVSFGWNYDAGNALAQPVSSQVIWQLSFGCFYILARKYK
jgi:hypothetical protein